MSKKTLKLWVTGLCEGNSPLTGEFPAQGARNTENISIWWRHHDETSGFSVINPLRAKFFQGNINIYLHVVSFLHIDATQVVEILPQIRQDPTYST